MGAHCAYPAFRAGWEAKPTVAPSLTVEQLKSLTVAMEWALDDRQKYLEGAKPEDDYGKDWREAMTTIADRCDKIASISRVLDLMYADDWAATAKEYREFIP